jgi:hypothetical protein
VITSSQLGEPAWGRLGNQLFIVGATIGIAHRNGQQAVFPDWAYSRYLAQPLPNGHLPRARVVRQRGFAYQPIDLPPGDWNLQGFFQTERFFVDAAPQLRALLTPAPDVLAHIEARYGALLAGDPCSLHVRRGDYVTKFSSGFPPQPMAYYELAIAQFAPQTRFLVFSDDIAWCKTQFSGPRFVFVEGEKDIIDLFLMSRCRDHILANSSFSWWGAWLNPRPDKRVYCPARWFGPATTARPLGHTADLFPPWFRPLLLPGDDTPRTRLIYGALHPVYTVFFRSVALVVRLLKAVGLHE